MVETTQEIIIDLLLQKVKGIGLTESDIDMSESLVWQGVMDSLSFLEFTTELEAKFGVEFDFSELDPTEFTSVDSLSQLIDKERESNQIKNG